jgi:hypothetical protein
MKTALIIFTLMFFCSCSSKVYDSQESESVRERNIMMMEARGSLR